MITNSKLLKTLQLIILVLTLIFIGRVLAQLIEYFVDISFIPNFDKWQSGTVPYWVLLVFQFTIMSFMVTVYRKLSKGTVQSSKLKRNIYLILGCIYLTGTLTRHILGLTVLSDSVYFTSFISIYFHYVLASFLLVLGLAHSKLLQRFEVMRF